MELRWASWDFFGRVGIKSKTDPHSCYKKFSEMQGKVEGEF